MAKIFMGVFVTLLIANVTTFLAGITTNYLSFNNIISTFITIALIVVILAMIPFTQGGFILKWIAGIVVIISILFSINIGGILGINLGLGLASNLMNLFPSNPNEPMFIGYLFFLMLGVIALVDGTLTVSGSGE